MHDNLTSLFVIYLHPQLGLYLSHSLSFSGVEFFEGAIVSPPSPNWCLKVPTNLPSDVPLSSLSPLTWPLKRIFKIYIPVGLQGLIQMYWIRISPDLQTVSVNYLTPQFFVQSTVSLWLEHLTPDWAVWDWALTRNIVLCSWTRLLRV